MKTKSLNEPVKTVKAKKAAWALNQHIAQKYSCDRGVVFNCDCDEERCRMWLVQTPYTNRCISGFVSSAAACAFLESIWKDEIKYGAEHLSKLKDKAEKLGCEIVA